MTTTTMTAVQVRRSRSSVAIAVAVLVCVAEASIHLFTSFTDTNMNISSGKLDTNGNYDICVYLYKFCRYLGFVLFDIVARSTFGAIMLCPEFYSNDNFMHTMFALYTLKSEHTITMPRSVRHINEAKRNTNQIQINAKCCAACIT